MIFTEINENNNPHCQGSNSSISSLGSSTETANPAVFFLNSCEEESTKICNRYSLHRGSYMSAPLVADIEDLT